MPAYLGKQATPIPIIADRIALPTHAGPIDITTVLPHDLLTQFNDNLNTIILPIDQRKSAACYCSSV
jgi:hypothetical protein